MRFTTSVLTICAFGALLVGATSDDQVQVEVTHKVDCDRKTQRGDQIDVSTIRYTLALLPVGSNIFQVHYRGTLASDGSEFDASYNRGSPLTFTVGKGQVIKGWDDNLLDMCVGEKRRLTIPPKFGYGNQAMGPIPAGSTLIFETELMGIKGVTKDEL
ncbi:MAG: Peptidyl-prolyl cis-trans isomerase fpr2 [Peltula sp. TS41687]|nr:MAG: Peptidyl-prolyl cis-trans isomerase fpr2 [Peltula sp. TS41687]